VERSAVQRTVPGNVFRPEESWAKGPPKVMKNGSCSATTVAGSAALPFVISTGAQRSGEICGVSGPSLEMCFVRTPRPKTGPDVRQSVLAFDPRVESGLPWNICSCSRGDRGSALYVTWFVSSEIASGMPSHYSSTLAGPFLFPLRLCLAVHLSLVSSGCVSSIYSMYPSRAPQ